MINPAKITDFFRSPRNLQEFALFCAAVAGKNALQQAAKLDQFLSRFSSVLPFDDMRDLGLNELRGRLQDCKLGKYDLLSRSFAELAQLNEKDLCSMPRERLAQIPGFGLKTASFFVLHSRSAQKIAVLDTYVLRFLASRHRKLRIPPSSPQDHDNYRQLEAIFLGECLKEGIEDIAAADLACWNSKGKTLQ